MEPDSLTLYFDLAETLKIKQSPDVSLRVSAINECGTLNSKCLLSWYLLFIGLLSN